MSRSRDTDAAQPGGLNTAVRYRGRSFHVQTQYSTRRAPTVETLVFYSGQALVRMTASYEDVARRLGFTGDDGRHLLELQHDDLIRKIRHGMLRDEVTNDDGTPLEDDSPRFLDGDGITVDPREIDDPAVLELLRELGVEIDAARPEPADGSSGDSPEPNRDAPAAREARSTPQPRRPWWQRIAVAMRFRS